MKASKPRMIDTVEWLLEDKEDTQSMTMTILSLREIITDFAQLEADNLRFIKANAEVAKINADLVEENAMMAKAILEAQWNAEGGHWEESACPFCGTSPYYGCEEKSIECHDEDCIVRRAHLRESD